VAAAKKKINPRSVVAFDKQVGMRVRSYRNAASLSQAELGEKLGVSFQQIQKYEKGTNRLSFKQAVAASDVLNCTVAELAGQDGAPDLSSPLDAVDFKMMEELNQFEPTLKPAVLNILRQINNGFKRRA
jgi:transcriptional regulator with XRE-family HTH domain